MARKVKNFIKSILKNYPKNEIIYESYIKKSYVEIGYTIIEVPFKTIGERADFILNWLKKNA